MKNHHIYPEDTLTHARRESVYAEGELAFKKGQRRASNPYPAGSPTLEQVWWHGWDRAEEEAKSQQNCVTIQGY